MTSFRLTNSDRDGVIKRAMSHKFDGRADALAVEEHRIGMAAYEIVLPKAERQAVANLPEKWLRTDGCLRFRFDFRHVVLHVKPEVVVPSRDRYCQDLGLVSDVDLITAYEKLEGDRESLKAECARVEAGLKALVYRVQTLRQLRETWLEGEQFYAHLRPREDASVPAVMIEDLNKMLGLVTA